MSAVSSFSALVLRRRRLYPEYKWTGPSPKQLSLGRLAGGGALQGDTCNTAQLTKEILTKMIGDEKRRWRYWRPAKEGERGKKKAVDIWCVGEVVSVANGTTDKESPRCKHPLAKGAVRIKWPADADFDERETYTWSLLTQENWNKEAVLGWRYTAAQLAKLGAPSGKRPKRN